MSESEEMAIDIERHDRGTVNLVDAGQPANRFGWQRLPMMIGQSIGTADGRLHRFSDSNLSFDITVYSHPQIHQVELLLKPDLKFCDLLDQPVERYGVKPAQKSPSPR
jgi:hypothetical protein